MKKFFMVLLLLLTTTNLSILAQTVSRDPYFNAFLQELLFYRQKMNEKDSITSCEHKMYKVTLHNSLRRLREYAVLCDMNRTYNFVDNNGIIHQTSLLTEAVHISQDFGETKLLESFLKLSSSAVIEYLQTIKLPSDTSDSDPYIQATHQVLKAAAKNWVD